MSKEIDENKKAMTTPQNYAERSYEIDQEELEALDITFRRIRIPTQGEPYFIRKDADGNVQSIKELTGVIVHSHRVNFYYKNVFSGGSNPPDCSSYDGRTGIGTPGGDCKKCPYNQFGSGGGKSKACKNRQQIYLLPGDEYLPVVLSVPTGSLREFTNYASELIGSGCRLSNVVTRLHIETVTTGEGTAYSKVIFSMLRPLESKEITNITPVVQMARSYAAGLAGAKMHRDGEVMADPITGEVIEPLN